MQFKMESANIQHVWYMCEAASKTQLSCKQNVTEKKVSKNFYAGNDIFLLFIITLFKTIQTAFKTYLKTV